MKMQVKFDVIEASKKWKELVISKMQTKNFQFFLWINIYLYGLTGTLILLRIFWII